MTKYPCPCDKCICIPICRHKGYLKLFGECIYLRIYEPFYNQLGKRNTNRMRMIEASLKPTKWYFYERAFRNQIRRKV